MYKYLILLFVLVLFFFKAIPASDIALYNVFVDYKEAIKKSDSAAMNYFSRGYLEEWLLSIIKVDDVEISHNKRSILSDLRVGNEVGDIAKYEVSTSVDNSYLLTIYSKGEDNKLKKLVLIYKKYEDKYLIDGIERYL